MNNPYNPGGPGGPSPYGYGPPAGGYGAPPAGGYGAPAANPYAPPGYGPGGYTPPGFGFGYGAAPFNPAQAAPEGTGAPIVKWLMLGAFALPILCMVIGTIIAALGDGNEDVSAAGGLVMMGGFFTVPIYFFVLIPIWVYQSWQMLPSAYRVTGSGKMISPGQAAGFLFIPWFCQFYWTFVVSMGYCDALNYLLQGLGSQRRAPKGLALAACICTIVPYVNFLIAPLLWIVFAFITDGAKKEFLSLSQSQAGAAAV